MAEMDVNKIKINTTIKRIMQFILLFALIAAAFIITPGCSDKQSGGQAKTSQDTATALNAATTQVTAKTFNAATTQVTKVTPDTTTLNTAMTQETRITPDTTTKITETATPKSKISDGVSTAANPEASEPTYKYQAPGAAATTARTTTMPQAIAATSSQVIAATTTSSKSNSLSAPQPVSQDLQVYSVNLAAKADADTIDSIRLTLDGNPVYFHKPGASVIFKDGRYYFDPDAIAEAFASASANASGFRANAEKTDASAYRGALDESDAKIYRGKLDNGYISLYEICDAYGLLAKWDRAAKTINLFSGYSRPTPKDIPRSNNTGLLRFEDIAATGENYSFDNELLCLRVMSEYLYSEGAIFAVAWTPRYVDPGNKYDNDLANDYSVYNAEFVFTMDYMIDRGAEIGLHGYTHQSGTKISLAGFEFSESLNNTAKATRERIEAAIASAEKLGFPVDFFEFPHYSGSEMQFKIAEEYFDTIYNHPYKKFPTKVYTVTKGERKVNYIHTTLDYLKSLDDIDNMVNKIKNIGKTSLASLFYHVHFEHGFIGISVPDGKTLEIKYHDTSPLHRIVNAMHATGRSFASLHDF